MYIPHTSYRVRIYYAVAQARVKRIKEKIKGKINWNLRNEAIPPWLHMHPAGTWVLHFVAAYSANELDETLPEGGSR